MKRPGRDFNGNEVRDGVCICMLVCALFYRLIHLGNCVNQLQKRDHKNSVESNLHRAVFQSCRSVLGAKVAYEVGLLRYDQIIITIIFPNAEITII